MLKALITKMIDDETEIITVIVGEDGSEEEANEVIEEIESQHEDLEFELHIGSQPVYSYLISVE